MARFRYQTGSLFVRNRRWIARWREDIMRPDGIRRIRRTEVLGTLAEIPTRKLARRNLDLLLARINAPSYRPGRIATLEEFSERWKAEILAQRKPSTAAASRWHLRVHILPALGAQRLDQIAHETVQRFVTSLSTRIARKTVLNVLGTLTSMLRTANDWGYTCQPPEIRRIVFPPQTEKVAARFFTAEQAKAIIANAREPYATFFALAAMTGMRAGELVALKLEDLDLEHRLVYVRRAAWYGKVQAPKTKAGVRILPMPDALAARFRAYLLTWKPNAQGFLFATRSGRPWSANNIVQRILWPLLDTLKVKRCGLHAFRHTHSSLLVAMGAPMTVAQAQLGHSDARLTLAVYSHVLGDAQREAVNKIGLVLDSNGPTTQAASQLIQ